MFLVLALQSRSFKGTVGHGGLWTRLGKWGVGVCVTETPVGVGRLQY